MIPRPHLVPTVKTIKTYIKTCTIFLRYRISKEYGTTTLTVGETGYRYAMLLEKLIQFFK